MSEYEYMVLPIGGLASAATNAAGQLNRLGAEGWQVVAALTNNGATKDLILMREVGEVGDAGTGAGM